MSEQTYTLDEARAEMKRRECIEHGHSYSVEATRTMVTAGEPHTIFCDNCGESWAVK